MVFICYVVSAGSSSQSSTLLDDMSSALCQMTWEQKHVLPLWSLITKCQVNHQISLISLTFWLISLISLTFGKFLPGYWPCGWHVDDIHASRWCADDVWMTYMLLDDVWMTFVIPQQNLAPSLALVSSAHHLHVIRTSSARDSIPEIFPVKQQSNSSAKNKELKFTRKTVRCSRIAYREKHNYSRPLKHMCFCYFQGLNSKLIAFDIDMGGEVDFMCRKDGQYKVHAYGIEDTFGTYFSIIFPQPKAFFLITMGYKC